MIKRLKVVLASKAYNPGRKKRYNCVSVIPRPKLKLKIVQICRYVKKISVNPVLTKCDNPLGKNIKINPCL